MGTGQRDVWGADPGHRLSHVLLAQQRAGNARCHQGQPPQIAAGTQRHCHTSANHRSLRQSTELDTSTGTSQSTDETVSSETCSTTTSGYDEVHVCDNVNYKSNIILSRRFHETVDARDALNAPPG